MTHEYLIGDDAEQSDGIARRTIVKGAAWSIPVIATAVTVPAATASAPMGGLGLAVSQAAACNTVTLTSSTVTDSGAQIPYAGKSVTVLLTGGYAFLTAQGPIDTFVTSTDTNGKIMNLPVIQIPADAGTGAISVVAEDGGNSLQSNPVPLLGKSPVPVTQSWLYGPNPVVAAVPLGSTPLVGGFFLSPDGWIYAANGVRLSVQTKPIAEVGRILSLNGRWILPLSFEDGYTGVFNSDGVYDETVRLVLQGAKPLYGGWFLQDEKIYNDNGTVVAGTVPAWEATGITDVGQPLAVGTTFILPATRDGVRGWYTNPTEHPAWIPAVTTGFPADARPYFGAWFIGSDGTIYDGTTEAPVLVFLTSGISSAPQISTDDDATGYEYSGNGWLLPVIKADGTHGFFQGLNGSVFFHEANSFIPAGSAPKYGAWFLTPDGELRSGIDGSSLNPVGQKVTLTGQPFDNSGGGLLYPVQTQPLSC